MPEQDELDEQTIREIQPSMKAYMLHMVIAAIALITVILAPLGVTIFIIIWLKSKMEKYTITNERLITSRGIIARKLEEVELFRIKDVTVSQGFIDRMFNTGSVKIITVDASTPALYFKGIESPLEIKEQLRALYRSARKKERVVNTELMYGA